LSTGLPDVADSRDPTGNRLGNRRQLPLSAPMIKVP
jgi:hypothetical protein